MHAFTPKDGSARKRKFTKTTLITLSCVICLLALATYAYVQLTAICPPGCGPESPERIFVTSEVDTALLAYKTNTGDYPTTQQGLQALIKQPEGVKGWRGPYLTSNDVPKDPWGNYYRYAYPSTHGQAAGKYDCWSLGPDGIDGTKDDVGNWPTDD